MDYQAASDRILPKLGSFIYVDEHGHGILSFRRDSGCELELASYRPTTGIVKFLYDPRQRLMAPGYLESRVSFVFTYDPKGQTLEFLKLTGEGIRPGVVPRPGQIYRKAPSFPADWNKLPHYKSTVI